MKKVFMFLLVILLTGCDITYNLEIDDNYVENISINEYTSGSDDDELLLRLDTGIPLYKNSNNNGFYKYDINSSGNFLNLSLNGEFDNFYRGSNAVYQACSDYKLESVDNLLVMHASGFKLFDEYKMLETITVNIKCKYNVVKNNADSFKDGVYTWKITRDNYNSKDIYLSYNSLDYFESPNGIIVHFGVVMAFIFGICFLFYCFLRIKFNKKNDF